MHLEDRLTIQTPEGVDIELTLAGLGSRLGAALLDAAIQLALVVAVVVALTLAGSALPADLGVFVLGIGALILTGIMVGYYVLFEALGGGRTPGKAAFGIRVATVDGSPLTAVAVVLRTLMRLVDFLPGGYAAGAVSIVVTSRNQRLGDLVAGTVVIRDRKPALSPAAATSADRQGWDVSAVTGDEVALIRRFASRREGLTPSARTRLAAELADRLRPRVAGGVDLGDEEFLLQVLTEKESR